MAEPFITFHKTLDEALSKKESPIANLFEYRAVQLLPNKEDAYVQFTNHPTGVELEDWQVFAVTLCGTKTDITNSFSVFTNFTDTSGMPQIVWQLKNLPELGNGFVYLEVKQLFGETFYTSAFQVTNYKSEFTSRFDYKEKKTDYYQSIQLKTWFRQKLNRDELSTYYEISTGNTVTNTYKKSTVEKWFTELFSNEIMLQFRDLLNCRIKYINKARFNLYEAFEIPELSGKENFSQQQYLLSVDYTDILTENPNEMTITEQIDLLMAITKPLIDMNTPLVFLRPANEIPAGYIEWTGAAGEFVVGRKEGDSDFGTLLNGGGAKTVTLTVNNLPAHSHGQKASSDVADNVKQVRNVAGTDSGIRQQTDSSVVTSKTQLYTDSVGGGQAFNNMNPYRIVNYIIWNGL